MTPTVELVKVLALAALVGLVTAVWLEPLYAAIAGVAALWLLTVRVT